MADDTTLTKVLTELDGIANAPMTASQRLTRAQPALSTASLSAAELANRWTREDLLWNHRKATEHGIPQSQWQEALRLAATASAADLATLLDSLHRAESAANMLKAGYKGTRSASGELAWTR